MRDQPVHPDFDSRAVSVYGSGDAMDDFPVLKAFQQYIDAEHAKARKRLFALGAFFCVLTFAVIAVFVVLLMNVTSRNQQLNDRLVEFAMRERAPAGSPVVVQPAPDSSAILTLTSKLEDLQRKLSETQSKADKAVAEAEAKARQAAEAAERPKGPTAEELEISRLKAQLADEQKKAAEEKALRREAELEAYRRKHYPELYAPKPAVTDDKSIDRLLDDLDSLDAAEEDAHEDADALTPIDYFESKSPSAKSVKSPSAKSVKSPSAKSASTPSRMDTPASSPQSVSVPDGNGATDWIIPE